MTKQTLVKTIYRWGNMPGHFEAITWDGRLYNLQFVESTASDALKLIVAQGSEEFLRNVHTALGELLKDLKVI